MITLLLIMLVFLFLLYFVIKKAIDNSVTSRGLEKMYYKLLEIHEELKKQNGRQELKAKETYTFEQLKQDLSIGHEFEFSYKGAVYHISQGTDGWFFTRPEGDSRFFHTPEELVLHAKVNGKRLEEVWPEVEIRVIF